MILEVKYIKSWKCIFSYVSIVRNGFNSLLVNLILLLSKFKILSLSVEIEMNFFFHLN